MVDIDGTLALRGKRNPYKYETCVEDRPNTPILRLLDMLAGKVLVLLVSGRPEDARAETSRWLSIHNVDYQHLFMRKSKDNRKDAIVKQEIYQQSIEPFYTILLVLDDRTQVVHLWRSLGLTCLQVADGDF